MRTLVWIFVGLLSAAMLWVGVAVADSGSQCVNCGVVVDGGGTVSP